MGKEEIIYSLKDQLNGIKIENMDNASWGYEEGVLLSGNEAKFILDYLKPLKAEDEYTSNMDKMCKVLCKYGHTKGKHTLGGYCTICKKGCGLTKPQ